ncbi:MAG: murein DD-endopeptidase MepM/ murein hydrolase activator NlpD [Alphaproteobacteria bacterium]|jgi:murein DD-endopeptidase MepM/ murein hydrolase activator NlpD
MIRSALSAAVLPVTILSVLVSGCLNVFVGSPEKVVLYEKTEGATRPRTQKVDTPPVSTDRFHVVRSGDTVYRISRQYDAPIRTIISQNGLRPPYVLKSGRRLILPPPRFHTVRQGDTIYSISRRYHLAMNQIVRANKIAPPYQIFTGQNLKLYGSQAQEQRPASSLTIQARPIATKTDLGSRPSKAVTTPRIQIARVQPKPTTPPQSRPVLLKPAPRSGKFFLLPVRGKVISAFGAKQRGLHNDGVNIAAPNGSSVRAAENGIVVYSGNELLGYGNMVLVRHADGLMTAYGHNQTLLVQKGQKIRRGQVIAKVGSTGNVSAPQLHFEIRKGKNAVNPARYIKNLS